MATTDPSVEGMLEAYRAAHGAPEGVLERVAGSVASRVEAGDGCAIETPPFPTMVSAAPRWPWLVAASGAAVLGAAMLASSLLPTQRSHEPAAATSQEVELEPPRTDPPRGVDPPVDPAPRLGVEGPETPDTAKATTPGADSPAPRDADKPPQRPQPHARPTSKAEALPAAETEAGIGDDFKHEVRLLRAAQDGLRDGDPEAAFHSLAEHRRRFPNGKMAIAREVSWIFATCAAGRRHAARRLADTFVANHPGSPFAARVRDACRDADPKKDPNGPERIPQSKERP